MAAARQPNSSNLRAVSKQLVEALGVEEEEELEEEEEAFRLALSAVVITVDSVDASGAAQKKFDDGVL